MDIFYISPQVNAKIAERVAEQEGTEEARSAAAQARTQAEESKSAVQEAAAKEGFKASPELKKLFKEVARRIHPDYATDEADRHKRTQLMAEANAAYEKGDAAALRRILEEYESSPESVKGVGVAADLERTIRQIKQIRARLSQIELEIAGLSDSDIAKLRAKVALARAEGRELFTEMAEDLRRRIDVARRRFEAGFVENAKA